MLCVSLSLLSLYDYLQFNTLESPLLSFLLALLFRSVQFVVVLHADLQTADGANTGNLVRSTYFPNTKIARIYIDNMLLRHMSDIYIYCNNAWIFPKALVFLNMEMEYIIYIYICITAANATRHQVSSAHS